MDSKFNKKLKVQTLKKGKFKRLPSSIFIFFNILICINVIIPNLRARIDQKGSLSSTSVTDQVSLPHVLVPWLANAAHRFTHIAFQPLFKVLQNLLGDSMRGIREEGRNLFFNNWFCLRNKGTKVYNSISKALKSLKMVAAQRSPNTCSETDHNSVESLLSCPSLPCRSDLLPWSSHLLWISVSSAKMKNTNWRFIFPLLTPSGPFGYSGPVVGFCFFVYQSLRQGFSV
ncbi:hypothetical protein FRX31_022764 [Thalictrum thalictroides]|uniref:Transmembrane protein n=1 Tax=Thalictrum thalictroides TaxID=46969 RepID=A0A7J6VRE6_THATH|nr:hypothetical protein FRX31_022764 [Thalictrum thalictroides]